MTAMDGLVAPAARLESLLSEGRLEGETRAYAERLLARMAQPVRICLFGLPGSGKTALVQVLVGQRIEDLAGPLPTLELAWADSPTGHAVLPDGTRVTLAGGRLDGAAAAEAALVSLGLPLPALKSFSLLEVVTDGSRGELAAALDWASARSDIALWCSQEFTPEEQAVWQRMPDRLRDHGYLVLTRADELAVRGGLGLRIEVLRARHGNEFRAVLPVASSAALAGADATGRIGDLALNASGGRALVSALRRQIALGRQADSDNILLFLSRHAPAAGSARSRTAAPAAPAGPAPAAPESIAQILGRAIDPAALSGEEGEMPDRPVDDPPDDQAAAPDLLQVTPGAIVDFIRARAAVLCRKDEHDTAPAPDAVATHCAETAARISDALSDLPDDPALGDAAEDAHETAELITLLQIEASADAADDAVRLLLQLRRSFEAVRAA